MRRISYVLIMFAFLLVTFTGCQDKVQNEVQPQLEIKVESRLIEAVSSDSVVTEGMTKLSEYSHDLDLDNTEEKIELYTAAGRNKKGEMMWDDGQNWVLAVRDGAKSYLLLSGFVQLGQVYFAVSNNEENQAPNITVIVPTGASFSMKGYTFNKEKNGFTEELLYKSKDDIWFYNSIPSY